MWSATILLKILTGGINHDPDVYDAPETFNPDRYLRSEYGTKPGVDESDFRHTLIFGAGRVGSMIVIRDKVLMFFPAFTEDLFRYAASE